MKRRENVTLKFQGAEEALDNSLKKIKELFLLHLLLLLLPHKNNNCDNNDGGSTSNHNNEDNS